MRFPFSWPHRLKAIPFFLATCWIAIGATGYWYAGNYQNRMGQTSSPEASWPSSQRLHPVPGISNLVIAIHAQCPCSQASVSELQLLLTKNTKPVKVHALVYQPQLISPEEKITPTVASLAKIPGIEIEFDRQGTEIRRFHGRVSGEVWLYGTKGDLLFQGGITASRGHVGRNKGSDLLLASLLSDQKANQPTPVFGCSLEHLQTSWESAK